jgi:hypothetical protein
MPPISKHSVVSEIAKEAQTAVKVKIEYDGMVKMYVDGAEFPLKSAPTPDALWSINILKKTIIEFIKVQSYISILFFINKRAIQRLLSSFNRIGDGVMSPYLNYKMFNKGVLNLTPTAQGVGMFVENFLIGYGIEDAHKTGELLAHIIEFDAFYRFKLLDILSESNWNNNPRKEVQRLIQLCYDREEVIPTYMRPKLRILKLGAWILSLPSLKKAFTYAVQNTDLNLFKMDEGDYYWMLLREDYNYFGKTKEERMKIIKDKGYKVATLTSVNQ